MIAIIPNICLPLPVACDALFFISNSLSLPKWHRDYWNETRETSDLWWLKLGTVLCSRNSYVSLLDIFGSKHRKCPFSQLSLHFCCQCNVVIRYRVYIYIQLVKSSSLERFNFNLKQNVCNFLASFRICLSINSCNNLN